MSVLEISELGCHLATYRGFITLSVKGEEIKRIPFEQVNSIICRAHGISYTQNLLVKLANHCIPVVITDKSFMPVSMILPVGAHHTTAKHFAAQIEVSTSLKNQLWKNLIKAKIKLQAAVLDSQHIPHDFPELLPLVNNGDTRNIEAQVARKYWQKLFGEWFRRDRDGFSPNDMLNYGYTIFRSALARQVCASGLHPAIGIHHKHPQNTFCLVDDLIEPFRPLIDYCVVYCLQHELYQLNSLTKKILVNQLTQPIRVGTKWITVEHAMKMLTQSLAQSYLLKKNALKFPKTNLSKVQFTIPSL